MNRTTKFYRLNWASGGFVVIKRYGSARIFKGSPKFAKDETGRTVFGYCIYGSKRGYDPEIALKHFYFNNVDNIQELSAEDVAEEHFVGLL